MVEKAVAFAQKHWSIFMFAYLMVMFITGLMNLYHGYYGYGVVLTFGSLAMVIHLMLGGKL